MSRSAAGEASPTIDDEALDWVIRLTSGMADVSEHAAFRMWCERSPAHADSLVTARRLWTSIGPAMIARQETQVAIDFARAKTVSGGKSDRRGPWRRRRWPFAIPHRHRGVAVAAVMAMTLLAIWPRADLSSGSAIASYHLADGTRVTLAPGSALDVDIARTGERHIKLLDGEVMFDVAHDAARPFVIRSGEGSIHVLGTAFSVRRTGGMTRVLVTRGRVQVNSGAQTRLLGPDREVAYGLTTMGYVRAVDASVATGWTRNRLIFDDQQLGNVIAEVDRFDPRKIVLLNRDLRFRRVNALVDLRQVDDWLNALGQSEHVRVTHLPGMIVIR